MKGHSSPAGPSLDFTIRFCALLDGLALFRLRQMPALTGTRLIGLAMDSARNELEPRPHRAGRAR